MITDYVITNLIDIRCYWIITNLIRYNMILIRNHKYINSNLCDNYGAQLLLLLLIIDYLFIIDNMQHATFKAMASTFWDGCFVTGGRIPTPGRKPRACHVRQYLINISCKFHALSLIYLIYLILRIRWHTHTHTVSSDCSLLWY